MKKMLLLVCAAALICATNFDARANTIIDDAGPGPAGFSSFNITFGYDFTVGSTPLMITALGMWDGPEFNPMTGGSTGSIGDGFFASHDIGLWDNSGNLLAKATVSIGTTDTLVGEFRYSSVLTPTNPGPVILSANTTYVLGASFIRMDPDKLRDNELGPQATFDPAVSSGNARDSIAAGFGFPDNTLGPGSLVGPNAIFTAVSTGNGVPDGGNAAVMMSGAVAILLAFRAGTRSAARR
jgi:hypothetical protein